VRHPKYSIESEHLGDCSGPEWRGYSLTTEGNTEEDLIMHATVSVEDQDGGEIEVLSLDECPADIERTALRYIGALIYRVDRDRDEAAREYAAELKSDSLREERALTSLYSRADIARKQTKGE
jgi:hypothetical protein